MRKRMAEGEEKLDEDDARAASVATHASRTLIDDGTSSHLHKEGEHVAVLGDNTQLYDESGPKDEVTPISIYYETHYELLTHIPCRAPPWKD